MNFIYVVVILLLIALVAEGIYQYYRRNKRNAIEKKLMTYLYNRKFNDFYSYLKSKEVVGNLHPFNIEYLKMNAAIIENDGSKIEQSLKTLKDMKLKDGQKREIYFNGFNYYIDIDNKTQSKVYKDLCLEVEKDPIRIEYINRLYDIKIEKSTKYLDELLKEVSSENINPTLYLLIAETYKNLNDSVNENKYRNLYIKKVTGTL